MNSTLRFVDAPHTQHPPFCQMVAEGLSHPHKTLPCRFFYDTHGSRLFEQICALPEYYVTRTEHAILKQHAPEMIAAAGNNLALIELGSGSSAKTRLLLEATLAQQPRLHYVPVDISAEFLRESAHVLLDRYPRLEITAIGGEYNDALEVLPAHDGPRLLLFLGSNIGNFNAREATLFLARIRRILRPSDRILVGVDLHKERSILEAAYNDRAGVTAAFNKNLLQRINRELRADFDLSCFEHAAPWVEAESRIEMHLVSRRSQSVRVDYLEMEFAFEQGESIHTENSHKYRLDDFAVLCRRAGLSIQQRWRDPREWFAVLLLQPSEISEIPSEPVDTP